MGHARSGIAYRLQVGLTLSFGIAAGFAMLGMIEAVLSRPLSCLDSLNCASAGTDDFLPGVTSERLLPADIEAAEFRSLTRVGLALTLVLIGLVVVNLATAVLSRSAARRGEIALRAAIGATPRRLAIDTAGEAATLGVLPAVIGAALGMAASLLVRASWPLGEAPWAAGHRSTAALAIGVALMAVVAACLFWPVALAWTRNLRAFLTSGSRATVGPAEALFNDALAVVQTAASLVLLVAAGLLVHAFYATRSDDPTSLAEPAQTLVAELRLPAGDAGSPGVRGRQYAEILERVRGLPGAMDTSLATEGAWVGLGVTDRVTALCVECGIGLLPKQLASAHARIHAVSADFFATLGLRMRRGRAVEEGDREGTQRIAVISHAFAIQLFPNGEPIGKEIRIGGLQGDWYRVVGIVDDLRAQGLGSGSNPVPAVYLSILQQPPAAAGLLVRSAADLEALASAIPGAVVAAAPQARVRAPLTLRSLRDRYRAPLRWYGLIFAALAAAAVIVAALGLYALMWHRVRRRTRELGIRMALGAGPGAVVRLVLVKSLRLLGLGLVVGLIPLSGLARLLQLRFSGVDPWSPTLTAVTASLLLVVCLLASYRPARSASRLDPQVALYEL